MSQSTAYLEDTISRIIGYNFGRVIDAAFVADLRSQLETACKGFTADITVTDRKNGSVGCLLNNGTTTYYASLTGGKKAVFTLKSWPTPPARAATLKNTNTLFCEAISRHVARLVGSAELCRDLNTIEGFTATYARDGSDIDVTISNGTDTYFARLFVGANVSLLPNVPFNPPVARF